MDREDSEWVPVGYLIVAAESINQKNISTI